MTGSRPLAAVPDTSHEHLLLTPEQWTAWVLSQYGVTHAQVARPRTAAPAVQRAISLIAAVLAPRLSAPLVADMLGISTARVHSAVKTRALETHGISDATVAFHAERLVPEPHTLTH